MKNYSPQLRTTDNTPSLALAKQLECIDEAIEIAGGILMGKHHQIKLAMTCLLAGGHLLIEDLPGMGKTLLSHTLAQLLGLKFNRLQFTSDLLPSDIIGVTIFDRQSNEFHFTKGPIFTEVLLADEINRSSPKCQSALLEAMEEHQITVDGNSMPLPSLFFVIATQNPASQAGTYPLPESQLDRFLMQIELGYPDAHAERELLKNGDRRPLLAGIHPVLDPKTLSSLQNHIDQVHTSDYLLDYLQRIIHRSRNGQEFACGISPRGALALLKAARTWALLSKRDYVTPEDIQSVFTNVVAHRLRSTSNSPAGQDTHALCQLLLSTVDTD